MRVIRCSRAESESEPRWLNQFRAPHSTTMPDELACDAAIGMSGVLATVITAERAEGG